MELPDFDGNQRNSTRGDAVTDSDEISRLLQRLAELTASRPSRDQFHAELVSCLASQLDCLAVAVWNGDPTSGFLAVQHSGLMALGLSAQADPNGPHGIFLQTTLDTDQVHSQVGLSTIGELAEIGLLGRRLGVGSAIDECLQVFCRPDQLDHYAELLQTAGILLDDYYREIRLEQLEVLPELLTRLNGLSAELQGAAREDELAAALVNAARRFVDCDRAALVRRRGTEFSVTHVSGVEAPHSRSSDVRALAHLVQVCQDIGRPVLLSQQVTTAPAERTDEQTVALTHYQQQHRPLELVLLPLDTSDSQQMRTALVLEWYSSTPAADYAARIQVAEGTFSAAALRLAELPPTGFNRLFGGRGDDQATLKKRLMWAVPLVALLLLLLPVPFQVEVTGELLPHELQDVFAAESGVARDLDVSRDALVTAGQVLLRIQNPELQTEYERIHGRLQATRERLRSLRAERLSRPPDGDASDSASQNVETAELQAELTGLTQQFQVLSERIQQLEVKSPIDGQVLTWDLRRRLTNRPVQPGQVLMTVADPTGPWEAHLQIPINRLGYISDAQSDSDTPLEVQLRTEAGHRIDAAVTISSISTSAVLQDDGKSYVKAVCRIEEANRDHWRPGATIHARIDCGYRALGFVWFHDLFAFLRVLLFY